ncbi:hypothetical protein D3C73_1372800 [compost metagenome]
MTIKYKVGIRIPSMPTITIRESNVNRPNQMVIATIIAISTTALPMIRSIFFRSAGDKGLATKVPARPRFFFLV